MHSKMYYKSTTDGKVRRVQEKWWNIRKKGKGTIVVEVFACNFHQKKAKQVINALEKEGIDATSVRVEW